MNSFQISLLACTLGALWACFGTWALIRARATLEKAVSGPWRAVAEADSFVDPWMLQRLLMKASDQAMPEAPELNKTVLLYWGLKLEEMAETGDALHAILMRAWGADHRVGDRAGSLTIDITPRRVSSELLDLRAEIASASARMNRSSKIVKHIISRFAGLATLPLTREETRELLDGTTDEAVVNAGFSIAAGMKGGEAYHRVQLSNLSKRNPETGKIDKTPDGKWIKGSAFVLPDLDDLLPAEVDWVAPR